MTTSMHASVPGKPLRVWPAAAALVLMWLFKWLVPVVSDNSVGLIGWFASALVVIVWWLLFSRAPWLDRIGALALMAVGVLAVWRFIHPSITGGMMGMMVPLFSMPAFATGLALAAIASRHMTVGRRRATFAVAILVASIAFTVIRTDGIRGMGSQVAWRWTPTAEDRLLARGNDDPKPLPPLPVAAETPKETATVAVAAPAPSEAAKEIAKTSSTPVETVTATVPAKSIAAEWPGFRGPDRDGVVHGVQIDADWSRTPPVEIWRHPIGPGWSSFAVRGDLIYTQEQRGEDEIVDAYRLTTGEPVWRHRDPVRFYESNGGAGPRGTPTISGNRVFAFGATGLLNALDADTGRVVWSRNAAKDAGIEVPMWGFASSPLVVDDVVIVAVEGKLAAYEIATGKPRWFGPRGGMSYSSPHRVTINGVTQVLLQSGVGVTSVSPADGAVLWKHSWPGGAIVQPNVTADGDVLINSLSTTGGNGTRRLAVARGPSGWTAEERWTSTGLKPYYNDFVVHKGFAYGFDGSILSSIDLKDGTRKWKGGRYGEGQLVLLPEQDLLLVLSEDGELALVSATPDQFREVARFKAIDGKTWNHPVVVRDVLLVRNGEEMAAFHLAPAER
jgi:outer membrane protein assembly factor BamB